jgi:ABC-2 type transport system permease protein
MTNPIGQIEYDNNTYNGYSSCTLNVYECYTNTIALLKKYDIYMDSELAVEMIDSIEVTNYYPGYDVEKQSMDEIDTNVDSKSFVYTDKDQIRDIMENVINNDYYSRWYRSKELQNTQFSIVVNARSYISTAHSITGYYSFEMGKVPDFVYTDTQ